MNVLNQLHYHCLIDPSDNSIISQGETALKDCSPYEFGNRLLEQWGKKQLPSMRKHETRTLCYFDATNLFRPLRSVGTFTKGPFVTVRSVMGSSDPGYEEDIPYKYGYEECKPATYEEFPLPENAPDYLAKEKFYDPEAIKQALADCIEELKTTIASDSPPDAIARLVFRAENLVSSTGGQGLHPHPSPFPGPNEEEDAILFLDLVLFAILEANTDSLPHDVILAYNERQMHSKVSENQLRQVLASIKLETE